MKWLASSGSISTRLLKMNLLVAATALLLAAMAFFSYDLVSFRRQLLQTLQTEAQMTGENSVSALLFNDPQTAQATMQTLCVSRDVTAGALVAPDGKVFTRFRCGGRAADVAALTFPGKERVHLWWSGQSVVMAERIEFKKEFVGTVYIAAELTGIGRRAERYLLIAAAVLLLCLFAALGISNATRRLIAAPIVELAETARQVTRDRDYGVRAAPEAGEGEVTVLVDAFNEMLDQIQSRDTALRRGRDELEQRVEERTAELRAANRELEAFSYTVAHDLRGPLDAISNAAYLLRVQYGDMLDGSPRDLLEHVRVSTRNMARLIDDLLHFSRATTAALRTTTVDLHAMAEEIAGDLKASAPERNVQFSIGEAPPVRGDETLLRVVLDNLIRNAWKYSSRVDESCIEFGSQRQGDDWIYFVRDNGAGFEAARAGELFKPFSRLHSKGEFPGTGIGLATVHRIIERHGGRIWATGAVGKGATFYFTLPGAG